MIKKSTNRRTTIVIMIAVMIVALGTGLFIGSKLYGPAKIEKKLKTAQEALKEGNYEQAIVGYTEVLELDDKNATAYEGRADANVGLKKPHKAIPDYHKSIEFNNEKEDIYVKAVRISIKVGKMEDAIVFLNEMKKNIGDEQALELREKEYNPVARGELEKKLEKHEAEMIDLGGGEIQSLEASTFFDIDGDGTEELLLIRNVKAGSGRNLLIYTYKAEKAEVMLDMNGYGLSHIEVYDETNAMVMYFAGHGGESYRYMSIEDNGYRELASKTRMAVAGGAEEDGAWQYSNDEGELSESTFEDLTAKLITEEGRKTETENWDTYSGEVATDKDEIKKMAIVIHNEEEAVEAAFNYMKRNEEFNVKGIKVSCEGFDDGEYHIWGWEDMGTHANTIFRWNIDEYGNMYDSINEVDL